jgi:hypothetical protein
VRTKQDIGTVTQAKTDSDPATARRQDDLRVIAMTSSNGQYVHAPGHYHPRRPLWLRALNLGGHVWQRLGMPLVRLNADQLLDAACQHTGLYDFGTIPFQESLQLLLQSCEHEARLNVLGRLAVGKDTLRLLINRLHLEDDWKRSPSIAEQCIVRPLFIVGLPRTGTSLLHGLLAQDPDNRTPLSWEVMYPSPPPEQATYASDPRIAKAERRMQWIHWLAPDFKRIHEVSARLPQECVAITSHVFRSPQFATTFRVPMYEAWIDHADLRPAYHFHRRFLQHLQWRCPGAQWVLKSPAHLSGLEALLETYPDAGIIQTHRDPLVAIPSLASLRTVLQSAFSDHVYPFQIGLETTRHWAQVLEHAIQFRRLHPAAHSRFCDVHYQELTRDPIGTVQRIYTFFGRSLSQEAEACMQRYLAQHSQHRYGEHRYTLAQFGLDPAEETRRYTAYRDYFGIPSEDHTCAD